jgi:ABC-type multidrug transport system fused ATPase/permease subunit
VSREDLWTVVGRSRLDLDFSGRLQNDLSRAVDDAGYQLDAAELEEAKRETTQPVMLPPSSPPMGLSDQQFMQQTQKERFVRHMKRAEELSDKAYKVVEQTFDHAAQTYRAITWMTKIMFGLGIGLFLFSALYAVYAHEKIYSLLFGGLGTASFIAFFILGPIDKAQKALSNLVQVEIAFMSYFDQISWWEVVAGLPKGNSPGPDPANIEKASLALQERSSAIIQMLQRYVEDQGTDSERLSSRAARAKVKGAKPGTDSQ